jgi:hypothetical protein
MSTDVNNSKITVTLKSGKKFQIEVTDVTELTDALLAARKESYEALRVERQAAAAAKKAERTAKKAERTAKAEAKKAERITALQAKLAALQA